MATGSEADRKLGEARLHLAGGRFERAEEEATGAIRIDGGRADAYLLRAEAHRRLKKFERALADLAVAIRLDPQGPAPYVVRADILRRRNVFDQAVADATHALTLDPRNAAAFSIRAQCRHVLGDREGAADDVRAMLEIDPTRAVPDLPAAATPASPLAASLDERFWKATGPGRRLDDTSPFADGRPVDRTYRSRRTVADEDAAEELGAASGYRPEIVLAPLPRIRPVRRRSPSRTGGMAILAFGVLLGAGIVLWSLQRSPRRIVVGATPAPPATVPAGPRYDAIAAEPGADADSAAVEVPRAAASSTSVEVDLLQAVDPGRALSGAWNRADGGLVVKPDGDGPAVLTFPHAVPGEYNLEVRAEPGKAGLVMVGLVHGGVRFTACLHLEAGKYWLQQFDGQAMQDNESTRRGPILRPGEAATFLCSVREGGVVVSSQGRRLIDWKGDYARFTDRPLALVGLPKRRTLFLASWVPARFTACRLTPISSEDDSPHASKMAAPTSPVGKWVELRPGTPGGDRIRTFAADGTFLLETPRSGESVVGTWRSEAGRVYISHPSRVGAEPPMKEGWFTISIQDEKSMTILMDGTGKSVWYKSS